MIRSFIKSSWESLMDENINPLKNIPLATAHLIMQLLAWMWCIIFSLAVGSYFVFGVTAVGHVLLLFGVFTTHSIFQKQYLANEQLKYRLVRSRFFS